MYGKVKLSKRQIKEDKYTAFMLKAKQQVTDSWQFYAIGLVALVLIVVAITFYQDSQVAKSNEATQTYTEALNQFARGEIQIAITSLNQIINNYSDEEAAEKAMFMLGKLQLGNRNYPEAIRFFEMYQKKYTADKNRQAAAVAGIAVANEDQGQFEAAASKYEEAIQIAPEGPMIGDYHFGAMRAYLMAEQIDNARTQLDIIIADFPGTSYFTKAQRIFSETIN